MADQFSSPPRDTFGIAYCLYFLLGISSLLPLNTFITAIDYFGLLYPWGHVNRVFTLAFDFTSVIAVVFITFMGLRVPAVWRVNTGLVVSIAMMALVPAMNSIFISNAQGIVPTYAITVAAVSLCGIGNALTQCSLVACIGRYLPRRYMQALSAGCGASGIIPCMLRVITKAIMPQTESGTVASAYLYFAVCVLVMVACFISYNLQDKLPFICYYNHLQKPASEPASVYLLCDGVADNQTAGDVLQPMINSVGLKPVDQGSYGSWNGHKLQFYTHVWNQIQGYALSVAFIYIVSMSIFPGHITEDLKSSFFGDWYPILLILCKNTFDVIGRALPGFSIFMTDKKAFVIGGSIARIVFYPLYYLCLHGPSFFQLEAFAMVITCIFGLTNGYFTSVLLMLGPKCVPLDEAEAAGSLMVTLLQVGIAGGSILQWIWLL